MSSVDGRVPSFCDVSSSRLIHDLNSTGSRSCTLGSCSASLYIRNHNATSITRAFERDGDFGLQSKRRLGIYPKTSSRCIASIGWPSQNVSAAERLRSLGGVFACTSNGHEGQAAYSVSGMI